MSDPFYRHIAQIRLLLENYGTTNTISAIKEACLLELENEKNEKRKARIELILERMETIYTEIESI